MYYAQSFFSTDPRRLEMLIKEWLKRYLKMEVIAMTSPGENQVLIIYKADKPLS